jgi:phosphatidylinositol-3-phosphatase
MRHVISPPIERNAERKARITLPLLAVLAFTLLGGVSSSVASARPAARGAPGQRLSPHVPAYKQPHIKHIWVIMLENQSYASTFGQPASDPYLATTLPSEGALLEEYYGTGHESNDNYVSVVSGQPPNPQNQGDCQQFSEFALIGTQPDGVAEGSGCVFPASVENIGTQLSARKRKWKAYMEDMGNNPARETAACGHPALNAKDETQTAEENDGYATRHNPFVYFESVIGNQAYCNKHVVSMGSPTGAMPASALRGETGLATDLAKPGKTPNFSFITPNLCNDGHDYPCKNQPSGASALADIDTFLETWVPKITSSRAFQRNGLLEITFDESEGPQSDSTACCGEGADPNSPAPGITGPGGGRIGAVLISRFVKPGTVTATPYNHYSSLASWESLFGLPRLADANTASATFGPDVFTNAK